MLQVQARLAERRSTGAIQELRIEAPALARVLRPGQAVLLRASWGLDPYLRRTFYPIAIEAEAWRLRLPPSSDRGLAWLRLAPVEALLDCLGPVGRGFHLPPRARNLLCLGEGELAWTVLPLVAEAAGQGLAVVFGAEATSERVAIPPQRLPAAVEYRLTTLDGSRGRGGRLAPLLPELLRWADVVMAAGSLPFYRQLADAIRVERVTLARDFAQVLFAADFLCGFGACQACAVDIAGGRRRVCLRGPVFDLVDVLR